MGATQAIAISVGHPMPEWLRRTAPRGATAPYRAEVRRPAPRRASTRSRRAAPQSQTDQILTTAIVGLKLVASALTGAAITLAFWPHTERPVAQRQVNVSRDGGAVIAAARQQTVVYRNAPQRVQQASRHDQDAALKPAVADRTTSPAAAPPRKLQQTVALAPPTRPIAPQPAIAPLADKNPLAGKPLRYLIGSDGTGRGVDDEVVEVSYSASKPAKSGVSIAYCNLFDERNTGRYGPYLHTSGTAKQYNEGQIDPHGPGWERNLREQFERRKKQGFEYIELDNADAYTSKDVIGAIELAATYGLKVIAKNPMLLDSGATSYVAHPNVHGIIVERGAGGADEHDALRRKAGKPNLPTWFVSFGGGRSWANGVAGAAKQYRNMGVTYSSAGEYGNSIDILTPSATTKS
jgi:hypothetical protein